MKISFPRMGCALLASIWASFTPAAFADTNVLFSTGFETAEGYDPAFTLVGQNGWTADGTGGNGLFTDAYLFPGLGQQAYIGAHPPTDSSDTLVIWKPINFAPVPTNTLVTFSVNMAIIDSTSTNRDDFRWSAYNTNGNRLFTLDFANETLGISYALDGTNSFVDTGWQFANDVQYELIVTMDFPSNRWSASLGGELIVSNLPITTVDAARNLGDIDAVWSLRNAVPGDNFMLFDNYRVVTVTPSTAAFRLLTLGRVNGNFRLRLEGESGKKYAIEASANLRQWTALRTNTATNGVFSYVDTASAALPRRFYRARLVP